MLWRCECTVPVIHRIFMDIEAESSEEAMEQAEEILFSTEFNKDLLKPLPQDQQDYADSQVVTVAPAGDKEFFDDAGLTEPSAI